MSTVTTTNSPAYISGYVVKEATKAFMNTRLFSGFVRNEYRSDFEERGAKKGDTIFVRRPAQFRVRTGAGMEIQDVHEDKVPVTLPEQKGVDFQFSARELTLDIDKGGNEYSKRWIRPAGSALASDFDANGLEKASKVAGSTVIVGYSDTNDTLYKRFLDAKGLLNKFLAPKTVSDRMSFVSSDIENRLTENVKQLYNNANAISKAIKDGTIQDVAGLTWGSTDLAYVHVNGAGGATFTPKTITPDYENLTQWIGYTLSAGTLKVGDTIEFSDSFFVNPETKKVYTNKLQRKVLATRGSGANLECLVYSIRPVIAEGSINDAETRKQFAMANCSATPSAAGTVLGVAGESYVCCPVLHKDAMVLTNVDLARPKKVEMCNTVNYKDVVIRFIEDYSVTTDQFPDRLDMLGVFTALLPEWIVDVEIQVTTSL